MKTSKIIFLSLLLALINVGCEKPITQKSQKIKAYKINNFIHEQKDNNDKLIFEIISPEAYIYPKDNIVKINQPTIKIYNDGIYKFQIESKNAEINNNNKVLKSLNNTINIYGYDSDFYIKADLLACDMDKLNMELNNNIIISKGNHFIKAKSGTYNFKHNKYTIKQISDNQILINTHNNQNTYVNILANEAYINGEDFKVTFSSYPDQVKTTYTLKLAK